MASAVYALCALTSALCAILLLRAYLKNSARLLLWSSLSFIGLTVNNVLLFIDLGLVRTTDLALYRGLTASAAIMILLLGLIWDGK